MKRKALERAARVPGFTPVPNARVIGRHAMEVVRLIAAGVKPADAEQQAWRNVAATLGSPRMARDYSRKPSKSDAPAYRKSIWPASAIEARRAATGNTDAVHESAAPSGETPR